MTPIKTGAWLYRSEYRDYHWCDLYVVGNVLVARVTRQAPRYDALPDNDEHGVWATMHECSLQFEGDMKTWISDEFTIHKMLVYDTSKDKYTVLSTRHAFSDAR